MSRSDKELFWIYYCLATDGLVLSVNKLQICGTKISCIGTARVDSAPFNIDGNDGQSLALRVLYFLFRTNESELGFIKYNNNFPAAASRPFAGFSLHGVHGMGGFCTAYKVKKTANDNNNEWLVLKSPRYLSSSKARKLTLNSMY